MKIKEFCEKYNAIVAKSLKDKFIQDNIIIKSYIPVVMKDAYAQLIVNKTMFEQEAYDDNGETKYRKTDKINVNSVARYIQFCRSSIELYTNLKIENGGFAEEYDALKSSGLLDILMIGSDKAEPLIPMNELNEFKTILDMKVSDTLKNYSDPQAFIERQIDRFKAIGEATLTPLISAVVDKIDEIPKENLNDIINEFVKKGDFKEV